MLVIRGIAILPRFMNRGLIEGGIPVAPNASGRPLPRFMNRGLIEGLTGSASDTRRS